MSTAPSFRLDGRTALITGAGSGIGRAIAYAAAASDLGPLSLAVNSAGIANAAPAEEMAEEQWRRLVDIDHTGVFLSCQAPARAMLAHGRGSIVNIASMSGVIVNRGLPQAHYNSAKAAVIHLSESLAMEWCSRGSRELLHRRRPARRRWLRLLVNHPGPSTSGQRLSVVRGLLSG